MEELLVRLDERGVICAKRHHLVDEERLRRDALRLRGKFVEQDALVRGVLVDDVEVLRVLRDDVREVDLADGEDRAFRELRVFIRDGRIVLRRAVPAFCDVLRRVGAHRIGRRARCGDLTLRGGERNAARALRHIAARMMHGLVHRARLIRRRMRRVARRAGGDEVHGFLHGLRGMDGGALDARGDAAEAEACGGAHGIERRLVHGLEDHAFVFKFHLALLRMDVDVDRARRHGEVQHDHGVAAFRHHGFVGVVDGLRDGAVLDEAAVDEERLPAARALEHRRFRDEPGNLYAFVRVFKRQCQQRLRDGLAVNGADRVVEVAAAGRGERHLVVVDEAERDLGMRQRELRDEVRDVRGLRVVRLEELLARGRIEKEVLDLDRRAEARAGRVDVGCLAARDGDLRAEVSALRPRFHRKARNGGNRRQRFAAEAERANRLEVVSRADLARRMAQDRETCVLFRHTLAVVRHAQEARAARQDFDFDLRGAGVDGIFDELLDDGGRALDDFAGSNLVDRAVVEHMDTAHERPASCFACSWSL